ncbi:hypothetical protein QQZ08_000969 [Neonectria magnoliae]|uniref:Uncharacterized protein n=1 Tax=Neonectria magnoliae TaxID=2732573 RepID=A0ABR1II00_9HYPO
MILTWTLRFNDVLDPDKLQRACPTPGDWDWRLEKAWRQTVIECEGLLYQRLQGAYKDILGDVITSGPDPEPLIMEPKQLKGFNMLRFGLNLLWELTFDPPMRTQMLYLPSTFVLQLQHYAVNNLKAISGESDPSFVSEGDVLSAWATSMLAMIRGRNRPLIVLNAVDAQEAFEASLGETAQKFRSDILQQITEPQIKAMIRQKQTAARDAAAPAMYGETNSLLMVVSNWTKANFFKMIDFSPAVIKSFLADGDRHQPGMIVYQHSHLMITSPMARNVFNTLGTYLQGNYWVGGTFSSDWWAKLEQEVERAM